MTEFRLRSVAGVVERHRVATLRTWKVALTWFLIEPAFVLVAMGSGVGQLVVEIPGHGPYSHFVTPGIIIGMVMFHALFDSAWGVFNRIQQGAFETQLTAPVTVTELAAGEALWGGIRGVISTLAIGGLAILLGWFPLSALPVTLLVSFVVGVQFGVVGLCSASASPSMSALTLVFTVMATPLFFFSGSFFPLEVLPDWIEPLAWIAPLTPGVHLARGLAEHSLDISHALSALYLVTFTVLLFPLAARMLRSRLVK
ncbi:ABC transporter permease [Algiphilus sp.]|uniref:ABC transporter permease n=1 Tax=Algiphilus sp. TaxID=1872431 RepID=UPI002A5F0D1B|nr:ABC transporter permease [Pseudomonadota bacterium]